MYKYTLQLEQMNWAQMSYFLKVNFCYLVILFNETR
jgi:hypothetical protein